MPTCRSRGQIPADISSRTGWLASLDHQDRPWAACQRWAEDGIPSWRRPEDGGFDARRYGAAAIGEAQAKSFVTRLHYSGVEEDPCSRWR